MMLSAYGAAILGLAWSLRQTLRALSMSVTFTEVTIRELARLIIEMVRRQSKLEYPPLPKDDHRQRQSEIPGHQGGLVGGDDKLCTGMPAPPPAAAMGLFAGESSYIRKRNQGASQSPWKDRTGRCL